MKRFVLALFFVVVVVLIPVTSLAGAVDHPAQKPDPMAAACSAFNNIEYKVMRLDFVNLGSSNVPAVRMLLLSYPDDRAHPRQTITISKNNSQYKDFQSLIAGDRVVLTCYHAPAVDKLTEPPSAAYLAVNEVNRRDGMRH